MGIKNSKWLNHEIKVWEDKKLVDADTAKRIRDYYAQNQESSETTGLGGVLGIAGFVLIALGILLILAKNWNFFPRQTKALVSFLPFLLGSFGGMIVLKKNILGWLKEAAAVFTALGILTAVVMSGQIYHVLTDNWLLFFGISILVLPLVYLFESTLTLVFYLMLGISCMFMTDLINFWIKMSVGISILCGIMPYTVKLFKKDKLSMESSWCNVFLIVFGFAFITSFINSGILIREVYISYFILLVTLDALLYNKTTSISQRPFAVAGNIGVYSTLFIFTFHEFWRFADYRILGEQSIVVTLFLLGLSSAAIAYLLRVKRAFTKRLYLFLAAAVGVIGFRVFGLTTESAFIFLTVILNGLFIFLAVLLLREGIKDSSPGRMNLGLIMLSFLVFSRFLDGEFSFLVKGIVFILGGILFLTANLFLAKKRRKELPHVSK